MDLLRGVAALSVVLYHLGFLGYTDGYLHLRYDELGPFARFGYLGVELFFMISGYVISMSVRGRSLRDFAVGRAIRLFPTYWLCMLVTTLAILAFPRERALAITPGEWILNVVMMEPFTGARFVDTVYWSLLVEIQFYVVAALAVRVLGYDRLPVTLLAWLLFGSGVQLASAAAFHGWRVPFPGQEYIGFFCVGAALSFLHHGARRQFWVWALLALGLAASCGQAIVYARVLGAHFHTLFDPRVVVAVVVASAGLVAASRAVRLGRRGASIAALVGGATYPLYLLHQYVSYALMNAVFAGEPRWWALATDAVAVIALACAVYIWFDRPVRHRLTARFLRRAAAATERAPVL